MNGLTLEVSYYKFELRNLKGTQNDPNRTNVSHNLDQPKKFSLWKLHRTTADFLEEKTPKCRFNRNFFIRYVIVWGGSDSKKSTIIYHRKVTISKNRLMKIFRRKLKISNQQYKLILRKLRYCVWDIEKWFVPSLLDFLFAFLFHMLPNRDPKGSTRSFHSQP